MAKHFLVISLYNDYRQSLFLKYHSPRNREYCAYHGFEYIEITNINDIPAICRNEHIYFWRHFYIKHLIETGALKDNDIIASIDADIIIVNGTLPFVPPEGKSFAYAIDSTNTHSMGAFTIRLTEWGKRLNANMTDSSRINRYKNRPFWKIFGDQACWYSLAGIKDTFGDPRQAGWQTVPHLGWNSTTDNEPIYSTEKLVNHVEILPVEWNVTDWREGGVFLRFPTKTDNPEDVHFRHFAGGQKWDSEHWSKIKLF